MKKQFVYIIIIILVAACFAAFGRIAGNHFINFDDPGYITKNYQVQSGLSPQSIQWAFTTTHLSYWHPLTWLSHMLDWQLFGAWAGGHHLVSLLFHIGAVIFLFLFLLKTTHELWPSAFAAAFFALHPLRVESVAWASERKDVLSMFFGMASLYAYAFYAENKKTSRYLLCLFLFVLSLMSKPMLVTLPCVLLLLDVWPLKRWELHRPSENLLKTAGRLLREKIPFFVLTLIISLVTVWAQIKEGAVAPVESIPPLMRLSNAIYSYATYLGKIFWPADLAVFYPYDFSLPPWKIIVSALGLLFITAAVLRYIKKWPFLFVGWFLYVGTLIPVIGLLQVGRQAMADRYTYLPSLGITLILAWTLSSMFINIKIRKRILSPAAIVALGILASLTFQQCGLWKSSVSLFKHALEVIPNNHMAHNNLASALFSDEGNIDEAIDHYTQAISIAPLTQMPYYNRGTLYAQKGLYQKAVDDFTQAISLLPNNIQAYNNRGVTYTKMGLYREALYDFEKVILLKPDIAETYNNRAVVYFRQNNLTQGCLDIKKACQLGSCKKLNIARSKGLCD